MRPNLDSQDPQQPVGAATKAQAVVASVQVDMAVVLWQPEVEEEVAAAVKSMWPTFVKYLHLSVIPLFGLSC